MNYRHAYHAGNFADVLKHIVLTRVIEYLKKKPAPFRVIDTHAGIGRYDLNSVLADKTGEWHQGILPLTKASLTPDVQHLLNPYLTAVGAENPDGELRYYPGSPKIAAYLLRANDRLIANELHPEDLDHLKRLFAGSMRVKVMGLDGWTVLKAVLPPKERRGVTLIDPPFENPGEFGRLAQALRDHHRRFATGTLILWYPIKDRAGIKSFHRQIKALDVNRCLTCELAVDTVNKDGPVRSSGLVVVNPPYTLADELQDLLPALCTTLGHSAAARYNVSWLTRS